MIHDGVELPKLLRIDEAAELLGVAAETIEKWIADRSVSAVHVNGVLHVLTESIEDRLGEATPSRPNRELLRSPAEESTSDSDSESEGR